MKLRDLRAKKAGIIKAMETVIDSATDGAFTPAQAADIDKHKQDLEKVNQVIAEAEETERQIIAQATTGVLARPSAPGNFDGYRETVSPRGQRQSFKSLFPGARADNGGWRSAGEFFATIGQRASDPRLFMAAASGASGIVGSDGGYTLPVSIAIGIIDGVLEQSVVLPHCRVVGMTASKQRFPAFDSSTAASGTILGGLTAVWAGEGETMSPQKPQLRMIELNAKKLAILIPVTNELLADQPEFRGALETAMRDAAGWFTDKALITGNGAGQPLGIVNAPSTITVTKADAQDAATFLYDNAIAMWGRLAPQCARNARWLVHPTTLPQLLQMVLPIGVGGVPVPVLREEDGSMSLLGRPVDISEKCSVLGTEGDVCLYDPSQLLVGIASQISIESSAHAYFDSDQTALRLTLRLDAQPTWQAAHTMPDGSNTVSWAVTCETRS